MNRSQRAIRAFGLSALVVVLAGPWIAADEPLPQTDRWALLIGIDDYAEADDLAYCGADQRALAAQLIAGGFPEHHVFLLESRAKDSKFLPTRQNIETQLALMTALVEPGDMLIFGFSGHGLHIDGQSYLCPLDARLDDPKSLVERDMVYQRLKASKAGFTLALIDACRDDPRPGRRRAFSHGTEAQSFAAQLSTVPEGITLLASCRPGEQSIEDDEFGHGLFMHFVLDGLRGGADADGNGQVSLFELSRHAADRTKSHAARKYNAFQRPELKGELPVEALDFAIARVGVTPNVPAPATPSQPDVAAPKPGEIRSNSIGMTFVAIPAGEFMMGSPKSEGNEEDEQPIHRVRITQPFYMSQYEVTKAQFAQFVAAIDYKTEAETDGQGGWGWNAAEGKFEGRRRDFTWRSWGVNQSDHSPVVNVTFNDALTFCRWLSQKEARNYSLPTEAQWEYACRGGSTTVWNYGDDPDAMAAYGNVADTTLRDFCQNIYEWTFISARDGFAITCPVGSFRPNRFGLYDMHGNVWEWCTDWYAVDTYRMSPPDDPMGALEGTQRVVRGGGWNNPSFYSRAAYRSMHEPGVRNINLGFRVCTTVD